VDESLVNLFKHNTWANLALIANVTSEGDVQLDGTVDGNLKAKSLVIGASGSIRGEVKVDKVQVQGTVTGPIRGRTVEIAKTAKVTGDVLHKTLAIEEGAQLEGMCKRIDSVVSAQSAGVANGAQPHSAGDDTPLADRLAPIR